MSTTKMIPPSGVTKGYFNDGTSAYIADNGTIAVPSVAVASMLGAGWQIASDVNYTGSIDCSASPNYPAAAQGECYVVSVAGIIGGASGIAVVAGDELHCLADSAAGTQAAVGANWNIIGSGVGSVTGPASSTVDHIALFNDIIGKTLKDGAKKITDLQLTPVTVGTGTVAIPINSVPSGYSGTLGYATITLSTGSVVAIPCFPHS